LTERKSPSVLSFSYCFPSKVNPNRCVFVLYRLAALAKRVDLEVVAPESVFAAARNRTVEPVEEMRGLAVHRPQYFYVPGILKSLDGRFYGRGLRRWFEAYCERRRPDLLDVHFVWPDGVGIYHMVRDSGIPFIITLRGLLNYCVTKRSMKRQCAVALNAAAAVISVSQPMARMAVEMGVPEERITVIPNGVDKTVFFPRDRTECRRQLDLPLDRRLIVSVAHLKRTKGHDEVVRAMAKLPDDVVLIVIGGDIDRGGYRRHLAELISQLKLDERVILAGKRPHETIPLYLSAADLTVLASHREGCPNVVLESLGCGTPAVAADVGAVPDLITPGENGFHVPVLDVDALADAMRKTLETTWSPQAISDSVESWDAVAARCERVLVDTFEKTRRD
jgi:glycosyltransferase involved in cell wall biosynthesis